MGDSRVVVVFFIWKIVVISSLNAVTLEALVATELWDFTGRQPWKESEGALRLFPDGD